MTFYFENMVSKHSENDKNDFLIFGEGPTVDIDGINTVTKCQY